MIPTNNYELKSNQIIYSKMKQKNLSITFFILTLLTCQSGFAYDFEVNGIYYGLNSSTMTAYVTGKTWEGGGYSGDIVIPSKVTYNTKELDVTTIGKKAFYGCDITSISIPNSVTSIEESSFQGCKITSINLPNNLITIGKSAFSGSSIISIIIPNSVERIGDSAFSLCKDLVSCILSNKIEEIGQALFNGCINLNSISIPSGVRRIKYYSFKDCNSLTKLIIPSNVETIESYAFYGVSSITEEIIEDSSTSLYVDVYNNDMRPSKIYIGREVYGSNILGWGYIGLKSITLGRNITGQNLPISEGLETIFSNIIDPKPRNKFWNTVYVNCKLYIPVGTLGKYQSTDGWKEFFQIIEDPSLGEDTSNLKCSKPTISYSNGKLIFKCETEGAICKSNITDKDITSYSSNEIILDVTYNISVYATKNGYEDSDVATATLCWIDVEPKSEGLSNDLAQIRANAVLVQVENGNITITGADEGTSVNVYGANGLRVGSTISHNGYANIHTNLQSGSIAIIKIGERSVKVVIK